MTQTTNLPEKLWARLDSKIAGEMQQDVSLLLSRCETLTGLYLRNPGWFNDDGEFVSSQSVRRLKGGLGIEKYENRIEKELAALDKIDSEGVLKKVKKIGFHTKSILKERSGDSEQAQAAIESHRADYEIARRDLGSLLSEKNINLPSQCLENLDAAYMIATSSPDFHQEWRKRAAHKDYVFNNIPQEIALR